jgi:hypothetical protein
MKYLPLALVLFTSPVAAQPSTNLTINITFKDLNALIQASKPLVTRANLASIESESCNAIRNGVEPEFIKAAIYGQIVSAPTRTYKYSEARGLTASIYAKSLAKCQPSTTTATK